jgi:hypothetical protein
MVGRNDGFQPVRLDMGIDLGRRYIGVPEHLLQRPEIGSPGKEMTGEGMPQAMR